MRSDWTLGLTPLRCGYCGENCSFKVMIRLITLTIGGHAYLNFMGNEFGHPKAGVSGPDDLSKLASHVFEACSGLRINLEKSELIPVGKVETGEDLEGCSVGWGALVQRPPLLGGTWFAWKKGKVGWVVRNLALMNRALLSKWNWCYANEREAFWKQVISQKYGVEEEIGTLGPLQVGSGRRVKFWKDKWCGDEPLCESFPLYFPSPCLKMLGCRMFGTRTVMGRVKPLFSQGRLMIGRLEMVERFMLKIQAFRVQRGGRR
ncbi:hypothetical protein CK203_041405 [Vitis vinifera]|uniref:Uncharacterized protein n=1 Tax=Vitis vinifera TaxID=29760 RepID=A0A438H6J8_VITVI|nr:hypothetical protein CK203_041405 [Vitis vinifera]